MIKTTLAAAALALSATASMAAPVDVNFDVYFLGDASTVVLAGSFAGSDTNNDGTLSFGELTSFNAYETAPVGVDTPFSLTDLTGFGDYLIASNTWVGNGSSWSGYGNIGYFTWNGGSYSANSLNVTVSTVQASVVPEPSVLAMMGLGAVALMVRRKRRAA